MNTDLNERRVNVPSTTISALVDLAHSLVRRGFSDDNQQIIVPIVGAGASVSAGLPTSAELKLAILQEYVGKRDPSRRMYERLKHAAQEHFNSDRDDVLESLSLPAFCSLIGLDLDGRKCLHLAVHDRLSRPKCRPVAYEFIAHSAKHGLSDHVISVNFDRLQDDALYDELFEKLHTIVGPEDVPGDGSTLADAIAAEGCYLLKPFGSLERGRFALRPEEIRQYGPDSVWNFCQNRLFLSDRRPIVILILVGYSASEPAFTQLVETLRARGKYVGIYAIDNAKRLSRPLRRLNARHIEMDADRAFSLIFEIIRNKRRGKIWVPVARHELITALLSNRQLKDKNRVRFEIEVILQAVKSRGYFTVDGIAQIDRIFLYANHARERLKALRREGILVSRSRSGSTTSDEDFAPREYQLATADMLFLANVMVRLSGRSATDEVDEWSIDDGKNVTSKTKSIAQFIADRLDQIKAGPDVELCSKATRMTRFQFTSPRHIRSLQNLSDRTIEVFGEILPDRRDQGIVINAVSSTGEWLFHESGWAYDQIGKKILKRVQEGTARVRLILTRQTNLSMLEQKAGMTVKEALEEVDPGHQRHEIRYLDWWDLNYRLTLVKRDLDYRAIYFERAAFTPLISPVFLKMAADRRVVAAIWKESWDQANTTDMDVIRQMAARSAFGAMG